jgi:hypothetical protein
MQRFSIAVLVLATAMALVIAVPVQAKPVKPDKPNAGFKPVACQVDVPFVKAGVRNAEGTIFDVQAESEGFTLTATELGGFP